MNQVIDKLIELGGVAGAVIVVLGSYIWYLQRRITKMQDDRVQDSKDQTEAQNKLANAMQAMTSANSTKMDLLKDAVKENKFSLETIKDMIRNKGN